MESIKHWLTNRLPPQQAFSFISVDCIQDRGWGDLCLLLLAVAITEIFISANCRRFKSGYANIGTHHNRLKYIRPCRQQWGNMRTAGPCRSLSSQNLRPIFLTDPTDMPRPSPGIWVCTKLWLDKAVCGWIKSELEESDIGTRPNLMPPG